MSLARTLTADRGDAGKRLDLVICRHLAGLASTTRTRVQSWIARGRVTLNGASVHRAAARTRPGDVVVVTLSQSDVPLRHEVAAEALPLDILYEDGHLLAVNKPPGVVAHPAYRHPAGTLLNGLLWHARDWPPGTRPSLVHRLDKLTSGVVIVAKNVAMHAALQRVMSSRQTSKDYLALVYGRVGARGTIDFRLARHPGDRRRVVASRLSGAPSLTHFARLARIKAQGAGLSLVRCRLGTGRLHQIRVHLAACGWPIVGDQTYGEPRWAGIADPVLAASLRAFPRQALHAWRLDLTHPIAGTRLSIEAPLPYDFRQLLGATGLEPSWLVSPRAAR